MWKEINICIKIGEEISLYVALWDQRLFAKFLLLKAWSADQPHAASWELDGNAESQAPF